MLRSRVGNALARQCRQGLTFDDIDYRLAHISTTNERELTNHYVLSQPVQRNVLTFPVRTFKGQRSVESVVDVRPVFARQPHNALNGSPEPHGA